MSVLGSNQFPTSTLDLEFAIKLPVANSRHSLSHSHAKLPASGCLFPYAAMDMWAKEDDNGQRARSFRHEDYNNRRVFLRSYPLPWEDQEDDDVVVTTTRVETLRIPNYANLLKRKFVFVLGWSKRKALLLRKLKSKLGLNLVPCHPLGLNPTSATSLL